MTGLINKVSIGNVCSRVTSGGTPSIKQGDYYEGGEIPWLNTKEISFNRIYKTEKCITEKGLENSSAKWINRGAIIVAMYGATAGKVAIGKIPLTTNQACCNLEVDPLIADNRYIYYWLMNNYDYVASLANGGAQQNLNAQIIKSLDIDLPTLPVQKSVADYLTSLDDKIELNNQINDYLAA